MCALGSSTNLDANLGACQTWAFQSTGINTSKDYHVIPSSCKKLLYNQQRTPTSLLPSHLLELLSMTTTVKALSPAPPLTTPEYKKVQTIKLSMETLLTSSSRPFHKMNGNECIHTECY